MRTSYHIVRSVLNSFGTFFESIESISYAWSALSRRTRLKLIRRRSFNQLSLAEKFLLATQYELA